MNLIKKHQRIIKNLTGGDEKQGYMFKHFVLLDEDNLNSISSLSGENILISIKRKADEMSFLHLTRCDNKDSIVKNGLRIDTADYTADLGNGLYCISEDEDNYEMAVQNMLDYVEGEFSEESSILCIRGTFSGDYTICLNGKSHEGYIVITNPSKLVIDKIKEYSVDDFLLNYFN